ncbi:MAG: prepilin-type N-terminal cleavage/methylation domain-containing protein [Longibaculum sp.]
MKKNKKGFTLIEIIVVIVVLAVLLAVAVPSVLKYINEADNAKFMTVSRAISQEVTIDITKGMIEAEKKNIKFEDYIHTQYLKYSYGESLRNDKDFLEGNTLSDYGVYSVDLAFDNDTTLMPSNGWRYNVDLEKHTITKISICFAKREGNGKVNPVDSKYVVVLPNKKMYFYNSIDEGLNAPEEERIIFPT